MITDEMLNKHRKDLWRNEMITDELLDKLENAIENRECFVIGNDWEMVKQWDEQIEFILEKLYGLEGEMK